MKILKTIFGRIVWVALAIIIQIAVIVVALYFSSVSYFWVQVTETVIGLIIFLVLINRRENPEFKLPWLLLLMAVPLVGVLLYILFSQNHLPGAVKRNYRRVTEECRERTERTEKERQQSEAVLGDEAGIDRYLVKLTGTEGSTHNRVTYFSVGEEFFEDLKGELRKAQSYIFMEYFIIDPGEMWTEIHDILLEKVKEGVEVRVMYDDIGTLGMLKGDYWKELCKEGINCCKFNPLLPFLSAFYNNRDHRKITVIDGKVGYTGGVNLGDEYINRNDRLGHWKDTAIKVEGREVGNMTTMFLQLFKLGRKEKLDLDKYFPEDCGRYPENGFVHFFGDGPDPLCPDLVAENNFINIIGAAQEYVWITTPYLITDHNLLTALRCAAQRGVDVRIVTPHIPDKKIILSMTRSCYSYLIEAGVRIYEYTPGFIHAKGMLSDDRVAFAGTVNLDYRSLVHHFECGAILVGTSCLKDIRADMEHTFSVSEEISPKKAKKGFFSRIVIAVLRIFEPLF